MRVLFVCRLFYPHIGGVEKHVLKVSNLLIQRGHSVTVLTEKFERNLLAYEVFDKIEIFRFQVPQNEKSKKFAIWANVLRRKRLFEKADIVHIHDVFFWYIPFHFLLPRKSVFVTFHGYEGNSLPSQKAIFQHKLAERLSKGTINVGDYLENWYTTKPTFVTYGAVDRPQGSNSQNMQKGKRSFNVTYIGRLDPEAGIMQYLKAVFLLRRKKIHIDLVVVGDGILRKEAEEFVKNHNLSAVFTGFVKDVDLYIESADFVFTSRYLGTLEAFAHKKYVFCVYNNDIKYDCFRLSPFSQFISLAKNEYTISAQFVNAIHKPDTINQKKDKAYTWVNKQTWQHLTDLYLNLWSL